jgi:hypothetical protein
MIVMVITMGYYYTIVELIGYIIGLYQLIGFMFSVGLIS